MRQQFEQRRKIETVGGHLRAVIFKHVAVRPLGDVWRDSTAATTRTHPTEETKQGPDMCGLNSLRTREQHTCPPKDNVVA